jgi:hypothetical protein
MVDVVLVVLTAKKIGGQSLVNKHENKRNMEKRVPFMSEDLCPMRKKGWAHYD